MKDNFSKLAGLYAQFRPAYPHDLVAFLLAHVPGRQSAWDCGTGNGQFAQELAQAFETVYATDISAEQISHARPVPNIRYSVGAAEHSGFPDGAFDLVCSAQAVHWFDFPRLFPEVYRVLKPGGIFAIVGYSLCSIGDALDPILVRFYRGTVGPFWDAERHHIDARYRTVPFPFREIPSPEFSASLDWTLDEFLGFIRTWSAVQHYVDATGTDPTLELRASLLHGWPQGETREVRFPFFLRIGARDEQLLERHQTTGEEPR